MDIADVMKEWDGECVVTRYDHETDCWFFIAVHSLYQGTSVGGVRCKQYASPGEALYDACGLAEAMSYKAAIADVPSGGGKAVIFPTRELSEAERRQMLLNFGTLIHELKGIFQSGVDLGITDNDADMIYQTAGRFAVVRTKSSGGTGSLPVYTALGVFTGIQTVRRVLDKTTDLDGCRVLVQGIGSVGVELVDMLVEAKAEVLISDINSEALEPYEGVSRIHIIAPDDVIQAECDIYAPCAIGRILNAESIPQLRCRGISGAANVQLGTESDADRLRERGIVYAPDFVVNCGGLVAVYGLVGLGWSVDFVETRILNVSKRLHEIFELAQAEGINTDAAAHRLADEILADRALEESQAQATALLDGEGE